MSEPTRNLKVLVVEDSLFDQELIAALLTALGCQVLTAANGMEAVLLLADHKFDIIFMDRHMPLMDGLETAKIITASYGPKRPRIIALTASTATDDVVDCLEAGMDAFIGKPITSDILAAALDDVAKAS